MSAFADDLLTDSDIEDPQDDAMFDADDIDKAGLVLAGGVQPADELHEDDVQQMELGGVEDVGNIAKLAGSKRMNDVLKVTPLVLPCRIMPTLLSCCTASGNRKVPGKTNPGGSHVVTCTPKPRVQSHCSGKQSFR